MPYYSLLEKTEAERSFSMAKPVSQLHIFLPEFRSRPNPRRLKNESGKPTSWLAGRCKQTIKEKQTAKRLYPVH